MADMKPNLALVTFSNQLIIDNNYRRGIASAVYYNPWCLSEPRHFIGCVNTP